MNKKTYSALIVLAAACGIANFLVSGRLSDNDPVTVNPSAADKAAALSQGPKRGVPDYSTPKGSQWGLRGPRVVISEYDPIIRQIAADKGYDWRFISAIACAESEFDNSVVSGAGAVGLMQITPVVARQFEVDPLHMSDPHTNVALGVEFLDYICGTLRFPASTPENDRLSIVLASYNCGMGHVLDARRLAAKYGENPNSWSVVSRYLRLKGQPEYYEDEVVRCGQFVDNRQTLGFVKKVMRYYDSYCELAVL